jgi:FKBP12-rapamycin complex-associated protein
LLYLLLTRDFLPQVRSLVVTPHQDMKTWLKYASLCRKQGRLAISHRTLVMLLGVDPELVEGHNIPTDNPHVAFAYMKHLWHSKNQQVGKEQC